MHSPERRKKRRGKRRHTDTSIKRQRRHHKRKSHFLRNLLLFVGIVTIAVTLFFFRLWHYLEDYQQHLPSMLGDEILAAYQSADTSTIRKYCTNLPDALQDDMTFHAYLNQSVSKADLYYYESSTSDQKSSITYTFVDNDQTFATLVVSKTPEVSKYKFPIYEITSLEQSVLKQYTFIETPGTTILVNGSPLDESYITDQTTVDTAFDEIGAGPYVTTTYTLPDYLVSADITAVDASGASCPLTWDEDHTTCTSTYALPDSNMQELSSFATNAAREYAVFATIKYASRDALLTCLYPGTDFYQAIKTYDNDWGITKTGDSFDNISVTDCIQYSDTEYSCMVTLDYIVKQGGTEKTFPLSFTCYITSRDGTYKIVNLETNKRN